MIEKDPFLKFAVPSVWPDVTGFPLLKWHAHEAIAAALAYHALFLASSRIAPRLVPSYYPILTRRRKIDFDIHVVSMAQALLILTLASFIDTAQFAATAEERIYGASEHSSFVAAMAFGYFLWDGIVSLWYIREFGAGFALHGVTAAFVFAQGFRPILHYYSPRFLVFELSTPFLNVNWFLTHDPKGDKRPEWVGTLRIVNGVILLAVFFLARIVWGFYQAWYVTWDFYAVAALNRHPVWVSFAIVGCNLALDTLNVYWFTKMIRLARRALKSKSD